jgi:hypothetical protein
VCEVREETAGHAILFLAGWNSWVDLECRTPTMLALLYRLFGDMSAFIGSMLSTDDVKLTRRAYIYAFAFSLFSKFFQSTYASTLCSSMCTPQISRTVCVSTYTLVYAYICNFLFAEACAGMNVSQICVLYPIIYQDLLLEVVYQSCTLT